MKRLIKLWAVIIAAIGAAILGVNGAESPIRGETIKGLEWKYIRDDVGRVISARDPGGKETSYDYEAYPGEPKLSKKITRRFAEGEVVTEFNREGRLVKMTDLHGISSYQWDSIGRIGAVRRQGTPEITYARDSLNRVTSLQIGDVYRIDYAFDYLGRLASMKTPAGLVSYKYQPGQGEVVRSLPNGVKTFWKRQANGELDAITHGLFKIPDAGFYTPIARYAYQHGPDGRISTIQEVSGGVTLSRRYVYDTMGQLIAAVGPLGQSYRYDYDLVGNRIRAMATGRPDQTCVYDWAGRLTAIDGNAVRYDASGNLAEMVLGGESRKFHYYSDGRLAEARVNDVSVGYRYDGSGRLIACKAAAGETRFIPNPFSPYWQPLILEDPAGKRTMLVWDGDAPLALIRDGQVEWLLHDHLGSVRLVVDATGSVKRKCEYDPFGVMAEAGKPNGAFPGFSGLLRGIEGAGIQTLARVYVPELGRFLQPDPRKRIPSAAVADCSLYSYCGGDPVNFVDRNGADRTSAEIMEELRDRLAEMRRRQEEMAREIRNRQEDMRMHQMEMQAEARERQQEMFERARQMSENVSRHQAETANQFRDGILQIMPLAVGFEALSVVESVASVASIAAPPLGGLALSVVSGVASGLSDHIVKQVARLDQETAKNMKAGKDAKDNLQDQIGFAALGKDVISASFNPGTKIVEEVEKVGFVTFKAPAVLQGTSRELSGGAMKFDGPHPSPNQYNFYQWDEVEVKFPKERYDSEKAVEKITGHLVRYDVEYATDKVSEGVTKLVANQMNPSPVGGVYLGGAGGAVSGLGMLKGMRIGTDGSLTLIGEEAGDIKLPPLRLDDLVTVFRSVYLYGEGPTVTIDPNPENPEKSAMIIVHSEATKDTYVGWILYQADRLMKGYTLGVDNITEKDVASRVPGYADVLSTIFFGTADPRKSQKEGNWERFWIVPAAAHRYEGLRSELTLFDVPLKVKTQKMRWENGKLVDDLTGKSSPGATGFTAWFTKYYDDISREQYLVPPPDSGLASPVPVFAELRKIALITAIAEKLRDQGVPMPFWMRGYDVRKVNFERFTPALEITRNRKNGDAVRTARIFGGVELSAESKTVKTYTATNVNALPDVPPEVNRTLKLAERLEQRVADTVPLVERVPLTVHRVTDGNKVFQAVSLPGADTRALDPCRLVGLDLIVPITGNRKISLNRMHNSFFDPNGDWGRGWTMDMPHLHKIQIPTNRDGGKVTYAEAYELTTPLNTVRATFKDVRAVPELGGSQLQIPDASGPFHGLSSEKPDFLNGVRTQVAVLKDGREWHFTEHGDLVAVKHGSMITVYVRRGDGRIPRIVGILGGIKVAEIQLEYSTKGLLTRAVGRSFESSQQTTNEVSYTYESSGRLNEVLFADGTTGYAYKGPWIETVTWTGKLAGSQPRTVQAFEYNQRGQVLSEKSGKRSLVHSVSEIPGGVESTIRSDTVGGGRIVKQYDARLRPTLAIDRDQTRTVWDYRPDGSVVATVASPNKRELTMSTSADGRLRTLSTPGGPVRGAKLDSGGKLIEITENQNIMLTQRWHPDGQLDSVKTDTVEIEPQYAKNNTMSSISIRPPNGGVHPGEWRQIHVDGRGKPVAVKDNSGLNVHLIYDADGILSGVTQESKSGNVGYETVRDNKGRVQEIKSSWGAIRYSYSDTGDLQRVTSTRGMKSATTELSKGLIRRQEGYDGGVTAVDYFDQRPVAGAIKAISQPNGLTVSNEYDAEGKLKAVKVGSIRRVRLEHDASSRVIIYAFDPIAAETK